MLISLLRKIFTITFSFSLLFTNNVSAQAHNLTAKNSNCKFLKNRCKQMEGCSICEPCSQRDIKDKEARITQDNAVKNEQIRIEREKLTKAKAEEAKKLSNKSNNNAKEGTASIGFSEEYYEKMRNDGDMIVPIQKGNKTDTLEVTEDDKWYYVKANNKKDLVKINKTKVKYLYRFASLCNNKETAIYYLPTFNEDERIEASFTCQLYTDEPYVHPDLRKLLIFDGTGNLKFPNLFVFSMDYLGKGYMLLSCDNREKGKMEYKLYDKMRDKLTDVPFENALYFGRNLNVLVNAMGFGFAEGIGDSAWYPSYFEKHKGLKEKLALYKTDIFFLVKESQGKYVDYNEIPTTFFAVLKDGSMVNLGVF